MERKKMGSLGQDQTDGMMRFALDQGINLIDTADVYSRGESETLLGAALWGIRDRVVLTTKARLPMSDTDFNHSDATRQNLVLRPNLPRTPKSPKHGATGADDGP